MKWRNAHAAREAFEGSQRGVSFFEREPEFDQDVEEPRAFAAQKPVGEEMQHVLGRDRHRIDIVEVFRVQREVQLVQAMLREDASEVGARLFASQGFQERQQRAVLSHLRFGRNHALALFIRRDIIIV